MSKVRIALMTLSGLALAGTLMAPAPAAADSPPSGYTPQYAPQYGPQYGSGYEDRHFRRGWDRINQRQAFQERRIQEGRASGTLTFREARSLEREQAMIRQVEANARSDGFLTRDERQQLMAMLDRADRHIERAMHNHVGR